MYQSILNGQCLWGPGPPRGGHVGGGQVWGRERRLEEATMVDQGRHYYVSQNIEMVETCLLPYALIGVAAVFHLFGNCDTLVGRWIRARASCVQQRAADPQSLCELNGTIISENGTQ